MSRVHGASARAGGPVALARLAPTLERELREAALRAARRDQDRAIAALQERLRTAYDAMACGVIVRDASGAIVEANDAAQRLFGISLAEMRVRTPIVRRLREDGSELPAAEAPYAVALRTRRPVRGFTMGALLEDGSLRWFQVDAMPALGPDGKVAQVVSSFVDITERKLAQEEAERRRAEAEALAEAARVVATGTAAGATLQSILEAALRVVPARVAFLVLPRDDGTVLEIAAIVGAQERRLQRLQARHGVTGRAFRTGTVQAVSDVRTDPDYVEGARGIRSELAVPIISGGAVIGVLNLEDDEPARFGRREARLIEAFAAHAAAALVTDRLLAEASSCGAELETRARQEAVVADLGQRGLTGADVSALMEHAVAQVRETLGVAYVKVLELLPGGQELLLRAGVGWKDGSVGSATVSAGRGSQAGYTLLAHEPVIVEDLATETRFSGPALLREHAVASGVSVVIQGDGGPYGVLGAHTTERRAFTGDDVHFLQAVANVLSAAIQRTRAEDRLRLLRSAIENANDAVVITDADLDPPGPRIQYVNPAHTRITGYAPEEVLGLSPRISQGPRTDSDVRVRLRQSLEQGKVFHGENVNYRKDGTEYDVELHIAPIRDAAGQVTHFVSVQRDVTERKRAERELERLALYDSLTGLPNRSLFQDRLELAIAAGRRAASSLALLLFDLDDFKEVNDTYGHATGDELLRQLGPRLRAEVREVDTVARLGGDEFAVLLPGATAARATEVARKLLGALARPFAVAEQSFGIGASLGISVCPEHGEATEPLLRCADIAMYAAKGSGSGCIVYAPDLDQHGPSWIALVAELRRAIQDGELVLHYQPIVDLRTGSTTSVEALVRWPHPERGLLPPSEFVPVAERTGLVRPLTEWVLGTALHQQAAWRAAGLDLPVAVNVSMRNLIDAELPETVERLLAAAGVTGSPLRLEITESAIMSDPERALRVLARLREMGVRADIDDFGTGYSSLAYLQRLPVDAVKVDRSFVGRMTSDDASAVIVRSTIELCHNLGLAVVAEGVEDRETWERLVALGCDEAQGHYLSAALAAPELERWLAACGRGPAASAATCTDPRRLGGRRR